MFYLYIIDWASMQDSISDYTDSFIDQMFEKNVGKAMFALEKLEAIPAMIFFSWGLNTLK